MLNQYRAGRWPKPEKGLSLDRGEGCGGEQVYTAGPANRGQSSSTFLCSVQPLALPCCCGNLATQMPMSDASRPPPSHLKVHCKVIHTLLGLER